MAAMLIIIGLSLRMEYFTTKFLPLTIGGIVLIVEGIGLWREISARDRPEATVTEDDTGKREEAREGWHQYLRSGAWVVGFFLAISLLGYLIAIPLFILSYMKSHGIRWGIAIILTILAPLLAYGIFELALGVELYRGLLFQWLGY